MKKTVLIVLILVMTFSMGGCNRIKYIGWKEVDIKDYGTIKVPDTWMYSEHNGYVYLTDRPLEEEGCIVYFVETEWEPLLNEDGNEVSINEYYGEIILKDLIINGSTSLGAYFGMFNFLLNGEPTIGYYYSFDDVSEDKPRLYFVSFNMDITYETLEKIAYSHHIP